MRYVLLICHAETPEVAADPGTGPEHQEWIAEVGRRGTFLGGQRLRETSDATTVRAVGDEVLVSDGPYAETKEQIAGFALIECSDLDVAIELAAAHPYARTGRVEVRPVWS